MGKFDDAIDQLRIWRENNDRKSREILELWLEKIWLKIDYLGKEKFLVLEQVSLAALDCCNMPIAKRCIDILFENFPNSLRVKKLEIIFLEADEKFDLALERLNAIIQTEGTNSALRKRKVAILKSQGRTAEAIKELTEYLKIFMADVEAWQELSELYINEQDFHKATFCVEELILHNPHNHLLHQRYAEIKYTQGGLENLEIARAYYSQALKLNPKNMRALYGLYLTVTAFASSQKYSALKKKDASKTAEWSLKEIQKRYTDADVIVSALVALQI